MRRRLLSLNPLDNRLVQGCFKIYDTHGLPLDIIIDNLEGMGRRADLHDFTKAAKKAGWKVDKTITTITSALSDCGFKLEFDIEAAIQNAYKETE